MLITTSDPKDFWKSLVSLFGSMVSLSVYSLKLKLLRMTLTEKIEKNSFRIIENYDNLDRILTKKTK